jgi:hypothetical protein
MSKGAKETPLTGMQTVREIVWQTVRTVGAKGKPFIEQDIDGACVPLVPKQDVARYLRSFAAAGALVIEGKAPQANSSRFKSTVYKLVKSTGEAPGTSLSGLGNLAMWRCMKVLKSFDSKELALTASHPQSPVSETTARMYIRYLNRAGYLTPLRSAKPAAGNAARYMLAKNTGPHAPAITKVKCVLDRNTGELITLQTVQEVTHAIK